MAACRLRFFRKSLEFEILPGIKNSVEQLKEQRNEETDAQCGASGCKYTM